ncbi:Crp/Fnr family transcriptional regulator [Mucilaginibacter rubeus]|uniref:Crp/Fnr family transcriptional regulator n=1 Tax=Mucilaginibacter rubeus TaxID=2027860 RepID=A0A5C1I021_9SPHI|nr:Crp/Fnr family transcriptional regulator [Mucilaginibacter rubeus]QEM10710.1 Crp/Fnr family transcriptional regulator [Mucilaginibacter rubeus]
MKEIKGKCDVSNCYLCNHCSKDWAIAITSHKKNYEVKKGQHIFIEGEPVTRIYFVYSGKIKTHKRWDAEKELIIRFAKPGDILGHMGLGNEPVYPVTTTALENSVICSVDLAFFESSLNVNPKLTYSLMKLFANELQESEKRMRNLVHMPVKERIALALLNLKKQFGTTEDGYIDIELSRQDLSSFAAVAYETLFKVMNEFQNSSLIATNGKSIKLLNEAELKAMTIDKVQL